MRSITFLAARVALLAAALCLGACAGSESSGSAGPSVSADPPTTAELDAVMAQWKQRDLSARNTTLLGEYTSNADYDLRIYEHRVADRTHYGAITIPKNAAPGAVPVLVQLDGLDQSNPNLDLNAQLQMAGELLRGVVYVVPTFRGRNLLYAGASYRADGDFCDAYDGATDDAIAFLSVAENEILAADMNRVMARGGSRGGNTALLMAERDSRIKLVLAMSAPTDFNRSEVRAKYGAQYRCQFIDKMTPEESRLRILASSPLFFPVLPTIEKVFIFHGDIDDVVPVWNANEMAARLDAQKVLTSLRIFAGYGHDLGASPDFRSAQRSAIGELFAL